MAKQRKKRGDDCIMGGKGFRCLRCGTEQELPFNQGGTSFMTGDGKGGYVPSWKPSYGLPIKIMEAYSKGFVSMHAGCKVGDPRGKARFEYSNPAEWIKSWDTGVSALAIYGAMMEKTLANLLGTSRLGNDPVPYDPADFGRCHRLLAVALDWRANLDRVAEVHSCWAPYVAAWPELEKLYEEELPSGKCPKLYERLKQIQADREVTA